MREGAFDAKAINEELNFKGPSYRNNLPKEIDTEVLTRRIEELNFIAEKQRIVTCKQGMKAFKMLDEVPIFFFANGLMIKGFPFYPYYSKQAQAILGDILDGYFPYDLKKNYPEGVPLKPVDFSEETYNNQFKVSSQFDDLLAAKPEVQVAPGPGWSQSNDQERVPEPVPHEQDR